MHLRNRNAGCVASSCDDQASLRGEFRDRKFVDWVSLARRHQESERIDC